MLSHFSYVQLFVTLGTITHQAPLSMGFSRQEYRSGLPCPPPGDLPKPGIEPRSSVLQVYYYYFFYQLSYQGSPLTSYPRKFCFDIFLPKKNNPGIKPMSLCLLHWQADSLPLVPLGKPSAVNLSGVLRINIEIFKNLFIF